MDSRIHGSAGTQCVRKAPRCPPGPAGPTPDEACHLFSHTTQTSVPGSGPGALARRLVETARDRRGGLCLAPRRTALVLAGRGVRVGKGPSWGAGGQRARCCF